MAQALNHLGPLETDLQPPWRTSDLYIDCYVDHTAGPRPACCTTLSPTSNTYMASILHNYSKQSQRTHNLHNMEINHPPRTPALTLVNQPELRQSQLQSLCRKLIHDPAAPQCHISIGQQEALHELSVYRS